jgi:hypothetical protein
MKSVLIADFLQNVPPEGPQGSISQHGQQKMLPVSENLRLAFGIAHNSEKMGRSAVSPYRRSLPSLEREMLQLVF